MKTKVLISALVLLSATAGAAMEASATEPLVLFASRTKFVQMSEPPGTVVVGNPSIADVTINGSQVFFHGRNYGSTNIILFNTKGEVAHEYEVVVQEGAQNHMTVYKGGPSVTYACIDECQPTIKPGDNPDFIKDVANGFKVVTKLANGDTASDGTDNPPTPPPAQ